MVVKKERSKFKHKLPYVVLENLPDSQRYSFGIWLIDNEKPRPDFEKNKTCAFYWDYNEWFNTQYLALN